MTGRVKRHERRGAHRERREVLLARLAEAEETLHALREGEVDALVVRGSGGDRIYTLHGADEPYRNLVEQMREGALVLAPSGDILYCNGRFAALVGEPPESVLGRHIGRFMAEAERVDLMALLSSGTGTRRSRLIAADGAIVDVYFSLTTTVSDTGTANLSLIVADLSDILEARSDRDRAELGNRMKGEFLATLAHELRTPLSAIRGAVGVLEAGPAPGPSAPRARAVIARQVDHLSRLIDDLLDVERVDSGKIRLDRTPLDIAETVRRAVASFTEDPELDRDLEVSTEPLWVEGDADRLEQVLANLVTNAIKYSKPGDRIRVSVIGEGDDAVVKVQDTGFGIAAELLPSIFDMFVQGEGTLHRAKGGLGIGLTLVRRLVELHGGTVTASSGGAGQGSTFAVRLPRTAAPAAAGARAPDEPAAPKRVLLIDDSPDARGMFRMVLELGGHTVFEAADGERGLQLLATAQPEVAVIDIGLPGLDGYQVARRIREQPVGRAMVLFALTGYGSPEDVERSAEAGFDHHLVKPVDAWDLARLLSESPASRAEHC